METPLQKYSMARHQDVKIETADMTDPFIVEDESDEEFQSLEDLHDRKIKAEKRLNHQLRIYQLLAAFFAVSTIYLLLALLGYLTNSITTAPLCQPQLSPQQLQQFQMYFNTDFENARPSVEYLPKEFNVDLKYNESSGELYRDLSKNETQFFGRPSPKIDQAWKDLFNVEFTAMSEDEARAYLPELKPWKNGRYYMEVDVFHSLNCLNVIRKEIDKEYYSTIEGNQQLGLSEDSMRAYLEHCMDQIFHSITCQGDLSPVPMYAPNDSELAIGIGQEHTCRNFEKIQLWLEERSRQRPSISG